MQDFIIPLLFPAAGFAFLYAITIGRVPFLKKPYYVWLLVLLLLALNLFVRENFMSWIAALTGAVIIAYAHHLLISQHEYAKELKEVVEHTFTATDTLDAALLITQEIELNEAKPSTPDACKQRVIFWHTARDMLRDRFAGTPS